MSGRLEAGDPERIGEFWLSGRLGAGGQGVVYDAYAPDGSRVAVKVLHGVQGSPKELERMAAEARAAQRVASFCTAKILQVRLEPPRPYIVSEYIDGLSLQDTVNGTGERQGRRFTGDDLHRLGIGVATALAAIHQARVVHRDLKPGNVMLGPDGPRLIDFGVARILDTHTATEGGGFAGTLRYMAPEVYAGQRAGAEADVFAWGAIVVFAATGEHAFRGGALPEIAHRIRTHHPDLSALPEALRPLAEAALAKDPLHRPSARTILAALTEDPREGAGDLAELVASGAAQSGLRTRWEPGDPALGKVAEDAYAALPPHEQSLVPEVFLRCVVPGEDGSLATRPVAIAELADRDDPAELRALQHLTRAFHPLLVETDQQVVLARPAVLRAWPRLRSWVADEREGLGTHQRIRQAARTWDDHGRRRGDVLTGAHLDEAVGYATTAGRRQSLNRLERGLLEASTRAQTARSRRTRMIAVVLAVTTVLSLTATGWAVQAQRTTVRQRDTAASRQLAAQSRQFSAIAPDKAALLAVAAHGIRETADSRAALLNLVANPARGVLSGYQRNAVSVSADRDGRLLAIGNDDGTIALWDVRRNRQIGGFLRLYTPSLPRGGASVALSPDGRTLAAAISEVDDTGEVLQKAVRLWDVRTRRPLGDLPVPSQPDSVVFTSDGKKVAVDNGQGVALWDVQSGRQHGPFIPYPSAGSADVSPVIDSRATTVAVGEVTGDGPDTVGLWDLATGRRTASFPVKGEATAVSPDGQTVVTQEYAKSDDRLNVFLWDARTGRQQGGAIPLDLASTVGPFSPDGRVVVVGSQLWEKSGTHVGSIGTEGDGSMSVATFADEDTVVSLDGDDPARAMRLWDVSVHQPDHRPFRVGPPENKIHLGFSPDGRTLVSDNGVYGGGSAVFRTWDITTGRETRPALPAAGTPMLTSPDMITVAPGGRTFATGNLYGEVRIWDPVARRGYAPGGGPQGRISAMAISPDGRVLATGGGSQGETSSPTVDGKVQLWDLRTRTLITKRPLFSSGTEVSSLAFSPNGRTLAAGTGRTVRLWNVSDHKPLTQISGVTDQAGVLAFAPDNRTLAIGAANTTVLWDVRDRRQIGTPLTGHSATVTALAFSRDGTTLATGGQDQVARLWDVAGQTQRGAPLAGHGGPVESLVFTGDGTSLITGDTSGTVRRWNVAIPADPVAIACSIAGRTLTRTEWAQYVAPGIGYRDICPSLSRPR
ncbi:protein kinase domain-containing protein [Thermomonospora umbrina]|uniref:protein kinase domain-containing protein n=1 Tax=Thermomonospora umbrina TaxID=111806 RepID=UPI0011C110A2|nr:protein kinase [Thermomonospora umbrina]